MYEDFFRLNQRPFPASPQVERYYPAASIEQGRKTICRCIERAEGTALVIGPSGTGKSLLCQVLARQFSARFQTALLTCGNVGSRRALLQSVLFELGQPYQGMDDGELRLALVNHLLESTEDRKGVVLFVDEAHTLNWRMLEELRLITNLSLGGEARVRMVLAGNGSLEEQFANPKLDSFSQRVTARCYLGPLDRGETGSYVRHQVGMAGGNPLTVFSADALECVYRATDGIPRLVNQVCDHALLLASLANQHVVQRSTVEEAWADLQQLPSPWGDSTATSAALPGESGSQSSIVEFGDLDDADDEMNEPVMNDSISRFDGAQSSQPAAFSQSAGAAYDEDDMDAGRHEEAFDDASDESPKSIPFQRSPAAETIDLESQIGSIEVQLARYDEDFRPAGLIGPEIELVFADSSNPFAEQFAEEEIIVDRYASLDTGSFAGFPTVSSSEGRELGARLKEVSHAREAMADAASRSVVHESHAPKSANIDSGPAGTQKEGPKAVMPVESHMTLGDNMDPADDELIESPASHLPSRLAGITGDNWEDLEDRDLIVIEEDPPAIKALRPKQLVRRQEYRQLFAKLRRG